VVFSPDAPVGGLARPERIVSQQDLAHSLGRRENGDRHLIQQRLKDTMVAAIDQDNVGIRAPQRPGRGYPGKASANNDDARPPPAASLLR